MNPAKQQIGFLQAEAEIGGLKHEIVCTQQSWVWASGHACTPHLTLTPFATSVNPIHLAVTKLGYKLSFVKSPEFHRAAYTSYPCSMLSFPIKSLYEISGGEGRLAKPKPAFNGSFWIEFETQSMGSALNTGE